MHTCSWNGCADARITELMDELDTVKANRDYWQSAAMRILELSKIIAEIRISRLDRTARALRKDPSAVMAPIILTPTYPDGIVYGSGPDGKSYRRDGSCLEPGCTLGKGHINPHRYMP